MKILSVIGLVLAVAGLGTGPANAQGAGPAPVSLTKIAASIPDGAKWGRVQIRDFPLPCMDHDTLIWNAKNNAAIQNDDLERVFREELAAAGYKVTGDPTNLFESDTKTAEFQVGALVTGIDARFCAQRTLKDSLLENDRFVVNGEVTMRVEWQVYSTLQGKVVARFPTTGSYASEKAIDAGNIVMLQRAFAENAKTLAASGEFRQVLSGAAVTATAARLETMTVRLGPPARRSPADASNAVAVIFAGSGMGSAFLISPDGHLLTNSHVVGDATRVRVRWTDQTETVGQVLRTDRRRDVALVKVDPTSRAPLAVRHVAAQQGETVYAIGTPLDPKLQNTMTKGIVSATREYDGQLFIQSDVGVTHGNSGGPLIDDKGAVIGMTVLGLYPDQSKSLNLFIPIGDALDALALKPAS